MQVLKYGFRRTSIYSVRSFSSAALLLCACILLILHRDAARNGVFTGVYMCLNTLIPSLFPFVLLSCLITRSRAAKLLFYPFAPVMRHIFRLPICAAPALLLGLTAGYPVGAKITASLYENGELNREQAVRLLSFCTAPGYAFCAYTASVLSGTKSSVWILFLSTIIPPLVIGIVRACSVQKPEKTKPVENISFDFTDVVRDGVSAMTSMCGFLVVFSALLSVIQSSGIFRVFISQMSSLGFTVPGAGAVLTYFLEVTAGVTHCAHWHLPLHVTAFGLGFAGLCIHLQLFSFFRRKAFPLSKYIYLLLRLFSALCSSFVCKLLIRIFPSAVEASAGGAPLAAVPAGSPALSAALLGLSVFFLLVCADRQSTLKKL